MKGKHVFQQKMKRLCCGLLLLCWASVVVATPQDSVPVTTRPAPVATVYPHKGFFQRLDEMLREFSRIDTNYIEPQAYNFTVMMQNTNTYEVYHLWNKAGQEIVFSPKPSYKIGPYMGWRWIFLGYTIDLTHIGGGDTKQDFNLSLYSSQIGADIFYRHSGNDYRISRMRLGREYNTDPISGISFDGFEYRIKGFNVYYIFNHHKFSYPAAYSQSTIQRRSCGSPLAGIGYTKHRLSINWGKLNELVEERLGSYYAHEVIDSSMMFGKVEYTDYSVSGGYAYNWVFAHNWLLDVSLQGAVGYKHSKSDMTSKNTGIFRDFDFRNFNVDGILRLGLVWNNMRWYVGSNAVFHGYNYHKKQFSTNNFFGSVNFYVGYNFGKKR